jgi:translocation and assembly module TamB
VNSVAGGRGFQVRGEVKTVGGSYRAYGQHLRIAQGVVRFSGPYDDPALNILALRGAASPTRSQNDTGDAFSGNEGQQQVGVQITGSARAPRLQLYALPDLPDSEKLAWLVLGRPASGAGAEAAAMQQAALALLGSRAQDSQGGLASALGLDELSLGSAQNGNAGSSTAALTVGKRISDRVYVAYEQSLGGAMGALSLFYDLSRRLTLRAQTGLHNAIDLVYTQTHE